MVIIIVRIGIWVFTHTHAHAHAHWAKTDICIVFYIHMSTHIHTTPYNTIQHHTTPYHTTPYNTIQHHTTPYNTIQHHTNTHHSTLSSSGHGPTFFIHIHTLSSHNLSFAFCLWFFVSHQYRLSPSFSLSLRFFFSFILPFFFFFVLSQLELIASVENLERVLTVFHFPSLLFFFSFFLLSR
ncbi:hypothetical protein DFH27DRAFT_113004 [Peziza echinospora]|nr:hypothetical protein DFH27DRAFT_113004 [Peziza echinospora]